ncbi:acyl transferase/acyl hydrolase/lysophospholipase [Neurospora crassa]|nr:acyl transferase/acyl hydrolase/lysophospholipase [Neurospora crassa]
MTDLLVHGPPGVRVSPGGPDGSDCGTQKASPQTLTSALKKRNSKVEKRVTFRPFSKLMRSAGNYVLSWRDGLTESERENKRRIEERMRFLEDVMHNATSADEWETAAKELDHLEGNDAWKLDPSTGDYHPDIIETKLRDLDHARENGDTREMMYLVRTALSRDLGGMGNIDLYRHSYVGTKKLIEDYVDSAVKTIGALMDQSTQTLPADLETKDLLEGMLFARQSFGRSALLLSGGATFGMSHIGVIKSLFEANLLPRIISGASAGSIVCSVLCTRKDEEVPDLIRTFPYGDLDVFKGPNDGISDSLRRLLTQGSWADITNLTRVMRSMLGDLTFQEAYNRTRRICNICVSTASIYELPRLLNYITAPNVMIWSAVAASCSVPLVFQAAPLLVKDHATGAHVPWNPTPQRWIDGSVDNDLPMTRLAEMFNVNHFIVSQVNPHIVPFLSKDDRLYPRNHPGRLRQQKAAAQENNSEWLYYLTTLAKDEAVHRLHFLTEFGIFPGLLTKLRSILSQRYSGDITILPELELQDLPRILKNPTSEFMLRNCLIGERATWPKLSRIRDRLAIELALDQAVHALRARVVFGKSQVDLSRSSGATFDPAIQPTPCFMRPPTSSGEATPGEHQHHRSRHHHRRSSASSVQILVSRHRKMYQSHDDDYLTDDQSEEDERLEMSYRRGAHTRPGSITPHARAPVAHTLTKPRLQRSAKSASHMTQGRPWSQGHAHPQHAHGHSHSLHQASHALQQLVQHGSGGDEAPFDFSRPLSPPTSHAGNCSTVGIDEMAGEQNVAHSDADDEIQSDSA